MIKLLLVLLMVFAQSLGRAEDLSRKIEMYFKPPAYLMPKISQDGSNLIMAISNGGRLNLGIVDMRTRSSKVLTSYRNLDVIDYHWLGNNKVVFSLGKFNTPTGPESQDGGGLFVINADGSEGKVLSPTFRESFNAGNFVYRGMTFVTTIKNNDNEIIVGARERSIDTVDLYRLNVVTGRKILLTSNSPGKVERWILDLNYNPVISSSLDEDNSKFVIRVFNKDTNQWDNLWTSDFVNGPVYVPLTIDGDNRTLFVATNKDGGTISIYEYDLHEKRFKERLARHPKYDVGADQSMSPIPGLITSEITKEVLGVRVNEDKVKSYWFDAQHRAIQKSVDSQLDGRVNLIQMPTDIAPGIVMSFSDQSPAEWFVLHKNPLKLEPLVQSRPWLTPERLNPLIPFTYKTRDGLDIPGFYIQPKNKSIKNAPTVIHIHGGPWVRADQWGYGTFGVVEGQFLASLGYLVIIPNFRATPGFGDQIYYAGRREFGRKMQEDIDDVAEHFIKNNIADKSRICLSGASYGGYSALMGLINDPEKYRCAVSGLTPTDLKLLMTSSNGDIPQTKFANNFWRAMVGDPRKDSAELERVSPIFNVDKISRPVLLYAGGSDIRVPLEQPKKLYEKLKSSSKEVEWVMFEEEGHGFGELKNNIFLYSKIANFLERHLKQ